MFGRKKSSSIYYEHERAYGDEPHRVTVIPRDRKDYVRKAEHYRKKHYNGRYYY